MADSAAHIQPPVVSVVIPTRNRLSLLKEAVASVTQQTLHALEVVVVDDASDDGTWAWLSAQTDSRIRRLRLPQRSERSMARNEGLGVVTARHVLFLDDDDRLTPRALELLVDGLDHHPRSIAAVGGHVLFDESGNRLKKFHPRRVHERWAWEDSLFPWVGTIGRTLFRTDVLRNLDGFRAGLAFAEDWELWLRTTRRGPILLLPQVVREIRIHGGQEPARDDTDVTEALAAEHALTLSDKDSALAARWLVVRRASREGGRALEKIEFRRALGHYWTAIAAHPAVLRSPIVRPQLVRGIAKSLVGLFVGGRVIRGIRRIKASVRRASHRDVDVWSLRPSPEEGTNDSANTNDRS